MSKSGLFSATVTASAPASGSPTTKHKGHHWFQYGEAIPVPSFILLFETLGAGEIISLPLMSGYGYQFTVDWGDGVIDEITDWADPKKNHTYASAGQHTVTIDGRLEGWRYSQVSEAKTQYSIRVESEGGDPVPQSILHPELLEIQQWGYVGFRYISGGFRGCTNLTITATDSPDLRTVRFLSFMFFDAGVTGNFADWDVSNIEVFDSMFYNNPNFNSDISAWDVGSGRQFADMFAKCPNFDGNLSLWDMSSATDTWLMFWQATGFTGAGGLDNWDVSSVKDTYGMFLEATSFNSDLSGWQTGSWETLRGTFYGTFAFNSDLSGWDVSNVVNFNETFRNASSFNSDVSSWDVSNGISYASMFEGATSFSTANYDLLLNAWSQLPLPSNGNITFSSQYTIATSQAARDIFTSPPLNWILTDLGGV